MTNATRKKTILVIEDELPLIKIIKTKLEKNEIDVAIFRTVAQAIKHLEKVETVDAIWLDHYLPGKENGIDFVAQLKAPKSKWSKVPIFVVSNTASNENVKSYKKLGVSKYYVKAVNRLDKIIKEIKPMMGSR